MKEIICSSCKVKISNNVGSVKFLCPECGKTEIIRCKKCRQNAVHFKCTECGFIGPN